ncbi:hypothetical protein EZV61_04065 [Corallincola luteus]|uniref:Uncharacterized protein n=1 Tax=Corallincola luteus TaxID=1775177 RepID=A0ABY2APL8_9GAMM|nr:hypothetical protein [Corallincola luteus]TCI05145.1 hypothetical protein EZV61_04065 [Corallincola luteus]
MFWNKKKKAALLDEPRAHHYTLAHIAFRYFCDSDPEQFFRVMASDSQAVVDMLWEKVCQQCEGEASVDLDIAELAVTPLKIGDYPGLLIEMPAARAIVEAMMILVVLTEPLASLEQVEKPSYRYFVLELGEPADEKEMTVFCEWADDNHLNRGEGCEPTPDAFIQLVASVVE